MNNSLLHACCVLGFQTREPINFKYDVQNWKLLFSVPPFKNELKMCCVLGLRFI